MVIRNSKRRREVWFGGGAAAIVLTLGVAGCLRQASASADAPLWPGSRFSEGDRSRAMMRALAFVEHSASDTANFKAQASDYVYCFYSIATTARDARLRAEARRAGVVYAKKWAAMRGSLSPNASKEEVADMVFGWLPASLLGQRDDAIKAQLRKAAARFNAVEYLGFDPAAEAPPADIPAVCRYDGLQNLRGTKVCRKCARPLDMRSKYEIWEDALITTYSGDRYGIRLGGAYRDVIKWIPAMRPYPARSETTEATFGDILYALTHLVYTLNDYGHYRLPRDVLPDELTYLKENVGQAIAQHDPETMGELLDSLKSLGLTLSDPVIRSGMEYLLETQRSDGTWGAASEKDPYTLYHSAWTAIDGLKDCEWEGERLSFPELRDMLKNMQKR